MPLHHANKEHRAQGALLQMQHVSRISRQILQPSLWAGTTRSAGDRPAAPPYCAVGVM